ncbi:unnamed protein product [Echinostoma caproni]|uniref:ANF_receptor domain-containing protein n=1 Tax=Echinostoma caproni TaxID=27848 RepID=A0A183ASA9_9TREM|nr:unnamed protein product [Echinostoma caproni]
MSPAIFLTLFLCIFKVSKSVEFTIGALILSLNALKATEQVCDLFNATNGRMLALIVSHPSGAPGAAPLSVSFTSSFYFLPTIGVSARQAVFSDKYSHASFLRTVPPYSLEAKIWADLITITRQVVINTDEENAARTKDFVSLLRPVRNEQTRAILVFLRRSFAEHVFAAARKLGMLETEWAWIVTEPALQASNIPQGVIGVRLLQSSELDHVSDAVRVATTGILSVARAFPKPISVLRAVKTCSEDPLEIYSEPADGGESYPWNQYAQHLYDYMLRVNLSDGRTGQVEFDHKGDRVRPIYEIVNAQLLDPRGASLTQPVDKAFEFKRPDLVSVGRYGVPQPVPLEWTSETPYPTMLSINMSALVWPGNSVVQRNQMVCVQKDPTGMCQKTEKCLVPAAPISFKKKRHLKVVTAHSIPFVHHRLKEPGTKCNESDDPLVPKMEVECKHTDPITGASRDCCCCCCCVRYFRVEHHISGGKIKHQRETNITNKQ